MFLIGLGFLVAGAAMLGHAWSRKESEVKDERRLSRPLRFLFFGLNWTEEGATEGRVTKDGIFFEAIAGSLALVLGVVVVVVGVTA
jgi:hypothetical protein